MTTHTIDTPVNYWVWLILTTPHVLINALGQLRLALARIGVETRQLISCL